MIVKAQTTIKNNIVNIYHIPRSKLSCQPPATLTTTIRINLKKKKTDSKLCVFLKIVV